MKKNNQFKLKSVLTRSILAASMFAVASQWVFAAPIGLSDVYNMAVSHDAKLAQAKAQYQADIQGTTTARAALLPQIQADGSYFVTDSSNDVSDVTTRDVSVTLNQSLYNHASWARYDQAKYGTDVALAILKNAEQDLLLRVTQSYFDVLLAQNTLNLAKKKQKAEYTGLEVAEASANLGLSSRVDVLQAKSSHDLSRTDTINAENSLDVALESLAKISGATISSIKKNNLKQLKANVNLPKESFDIEELEKQAETQNLSVKQAKAQLASANEEIEVQKSGYWPTVALQAKYSDTNYSDYQAGSAYVDSDRTSVGVTVSIPLFSGGGTDSQVTAAKHKTMAAQQGLRDSQESAKLNVRTLVLNLERGEHLILALREAVKSNDAFLESAEEGFKIGLNSMLEVLTARANQTSAHKNLIEALHNQVINRLTLEATLGDLTFEDLSSYDALMQATK